ncbi:hypothetical protein QUA00_22385 [Microcoleus sp. T2B6]|uniref:hypothetical protein n=1 Tax=Microcoleus sp. T2B6 TaxID=3055424 RepID=UPI002FD2BA43
MLLLEFVGDVTSIIPQIIQPYIYQTEVLTLLGLKARGFLDQPVDLLIDAAIKE